MTNRPLVAPTDRRAESQMNLQALQDWVETEKVLSLIGGDLLQEKWLNHWNKPLTELPEAIGQLQALTRIDLRHNGLHRLPESLGRLHRLEDLTCMGNKLECLPDVFHHLKQLRYLDMRENRLHSLPPSTGELESLQSLILRDNRLNDLPVEIGLLKRLERLDLCRNPLRSLPDELRHCESLEHLDISGTLISHLPEWLGEMKNLKHLVRGPNELAQIGSAHARSTRPPAPIRIDNEPFLLWFERALAEDSYGPLKITFRHVLHQDLSDAEIASKARGLIGDEGWPEGCFIWGDDERGEHIEYYLSSRRGDRHGRIDRDGRHEVLAALWQTGPIDAEYQALYRDLQGKGLVS